MIIYSHGIRPVSSALVMGGCCAAAPGTAPVAAAELEPPGVVVPSPFSRVNDTLRWRDGVPDRVVAVVVIHEPLPEPAHGGASPRGEGGVCLGSEPRGRVGAG